MSLYYFGRPDSAKERLERLYPKLFEDILREIQSPLQSDGRYLIGGIRGTGKTALRLLLQGRIRRGAHEDDSVIFTIDKKRSLPRIDHGGLYHHLVANWILIEVHNLLVKSKSVKLKSRLKVVRERVLRKLGSMVKEVQVGAYGAQLSLDFDKLRDDGIPSAVSEMQIDHYKNLLGEIEGLPPAYVLMDDIEFVFPGCVEDDDILFDALGAVCEINEEFNGLINVIVFINLVLLRKFLKKGPEVQKYRGREQEISWSDDRLVKLISLRIKQLRNLSSVEGDIWKYEFVNPGKLKRLLVRMNLSGPRDLIELCNRAKRVAKEEKISFREVETVLPQFAEHKLDDINRDFSPTYNGIGDVIRWVFLADLDFANRKALRDSLRNLPAELKSSDRTKRIVQEYGWFLETSPDALVQILYDCCCIGVQDGKDWVFFRDAPDKQLKNLGNIRLAAHPLFLLWAEKQQLS